MILTSSDDSLEEALEIAREIRRKQKKWDLWYLDLAKKISTKSKDPSTKVGAIIVDENNRPVSFGYNGLPQKIQDTDNRLNNRELKYKLIIHGEMNAFIFAQRSIRNCTLYTWPFLPCTNCATVFIQAGICRVVSPINTNERWKENLNLSKELFREAHVSVEEIEYVNQKD